VQGFPGVEKIDSIPKADTSPIKPQKPISETISQFGVEDQSIGEENVNTIMSMSKDQVAQEQKELLELFSPQQLAVLKRMGKKKGEQKDAPKQPLAPRPLPIQKDEPLSSTEDIGKAV
jgi:hypothetical protein